MQFGQKNQHIRETMLRGVQIVGGGKKSLKLNKRGVQISGEDKLGNPDLKIRYDFALFMPIFKLNSLILYENIPLAHREYLE